MTDHHSPPPSEIVQRYHFNTRFRQQRETVAIYMSELWALAQWCNFGDSLENMLKDRLAIWIDNKAIQHQLLSETTLTFKKALKLAQGLEAAAKNAREIQNVITGIKNGRSGSSQEGQWTESVGKLMTNVFIIVKRLATLLGNAPSWTQNVIIVGRWATSKRLVATRKTQGVVVQEQPDGVNNKQRSLLGKEQCWNSWTYRFYRYRRVSTLPIDWNIRLKANRIKSWSVGKNHSYGTGQWGSYELCLCYQEKHTRNFSLIFPCNSQQLNWSHT